MKHIITICVCLALILGCSSNVETIKLELLPTYQKIPHKSTESYLQKGQGFFESKQYDSVLVYCHKSYVINSQNWEMFYLYGLTATATSEYEIAENYLYKALRFCGAEPTNRASVYFALGENTSKDYNFRSAKQHYLMVIQLDAGSKLADIASQKIQLLSQIN